MKSLYLQLKGHDWYYGYSDDHRMWKRGRERQQHLEALVKKLGSPFPLNELRMAVQEMVVEDFEEQSPGNWYPKGNTYKNIAPTKRSGLMHRADQVQVLAWIESQGEQPV
jgi:hypothetical protein